MPPPAPKNPLIKPASAPASRLKPIRGVFAFSCIKNTPSHGIVCREKGHFIRETAAQTGGCLKCKLFRGELHAEGSGRVGIIANNTVVPCVVVCGAQSVLNERVAVGVAEAVKVHDMHAVRCFDNAGVAGLTALVEAPVVELCDHLAGHDVLIQAALVAVGIVGVLLGQFAKACRSLVACVKLRKDLIGLCAGLFHCGLVGGVADGDQDVAHIREQIVVRAAGNEVQNVVNAAVIDNIGRVTLSAGCVEQPVGNIAAQRGVQLVFFQRVVLVRIAFLCGIQRIFIGCVDEGLLVVCGVGGHRGGHLLLERGQLFLRQLLGGVAAVRCAFVAAVRRGLEQRVGDEELPVGHGVIAVGVRFILGGNLRVGIGEAAVDGLRVAACKRCNLKIFTETFFRCSLYRRQLRYSCSDSCWNRQHKGRET